MWPRRSSAECICSITWPRHPYFKQGRAVHNLGQTRSSHQTNHVLLTADTFVRTALPGMKGCTAIVHVGPALGAAFTEYTAEFDAGGELGSTSAQRFLFVIEGAVCVDFEAKRQDLGPRGYAYFPEGAQHQVQASRVSRVAVIEKPYQSLKSVQTPRAIVSSEDTVSSHALNR